MKPCSDSMPDVFFDDAEVRIALLNELNDRFSNDRYCATRRERIDASVQGIESCLGDFASHIKQLMSLANHERFRLVAMPAVHDGRQVNIDDVTGPEFIASRDSMADNVIDADATAFGIRRMFARIAQTGRRVSVIESVIVD